MDIILSNGSMIRMSTLNHQQMIEAIKGSNGYYKITSSATLSISNDQGELLGFSSGPPLQMFMVDLLNEYLGELNRQRIHALEQLDAAGETDLMVIAQAIVDPLVEAIAGPDGALVRFCHRIVHLDGVDIDQRYWWTPALMKTLDRVAAQRSDCHQKSFRRKASTVNISLYHFIGRDNTMRAWIDNLSPELIRHDLRDWLIDVVTAILQPSGSGK